MNGYLSNGSLLAGTTTGFYTIFVEPWDDIIVKGNTEYKSADNEISIFPNLVT